MWLPPSLKISSTCIPHSASNHSGTQTRLRLRSHQCHNSNEETYLFLASPNLRTCTSNSVAKTEAGNIGLPQFGFPRRAIFHPENVQEVRASESLARTG